MYLLSFFFLVFLLSAMKRPVGFVFELNILNETGKQKQKAERERERKKERKRKPMNINVYNLLTDGLSEKREIVDFSRVSPFNKSSLLFSQFFFVRGSTSYFNRMTL